MMEAEIEELWWPPLAIVFTKRQVKWLLHNLGLILDGLWPPEGKETGYEDQNKRGRGIAPFEGSCQVLAELEVRLDIAGRDSKTVLEVFAMGYYVEELAEMYRVHIRTVERRRDRAMRKLVGGDRYGS